MLKVTKKQVMDALRDRGAFTLKRNAEYQVGIKTIKLLYIALIQTKVLILVTR